MIRICILLLLSVSSSAQQWTAEEWAAAHTASTSTILTSEEKQIIRYINLARMYPQKFAELEIKNYEGAPEYGGYLKNSTYKASLYQQLKKAQPLPPLQFDAEMYALAKCFANESGTAGTVGHDRRTCTQGNLMGECCAYGDQYGRDIALVLLIDHDVPSLGHRSICLSPDYKGVGVKIAPHTKYRHCAVLDFR